MGLLALGDIWATYTAAGEYGPPTEIRTVNDLYYRYVSSGYGSTQAIGHHISNIAGKSAVSLVDSNRLMVGLNGLSRLRRTDWSRPDADQLLRDVHYNEKRQAFQAGALTPAINAQQADD